MHRAPAQRADLREAQHRQRQAPPQSIRRKSVPPADLATRRRERPLRHPHTHTRHYRRRRTPLHPRQLGDGPGRVVEIPVKKPFHAFAPVRRGPQNRLRIDPPTDGQREGRPWGIRLLHGSFHDGQSGPRSRPEMVGYNGPRRAQEGGHGAAHNGPRCVPQRLRGQGIAGPLDHSPGRPFGGAPRPKLPTHWQLGIDRRRTPAADGEARGSDAQHCDGERAGVAPRGPGAAPRGPGGDLLHPRDPGLQRLPTGGPWANVGDDTRQVPPGASRNGPGRQGRSPAHGQQTGGPQGGPANVAFVMKCDVPANAAPGAAT